MPTAPDPVLPEHSQGFVLDANAPEQSRTFELPGGRILGFAEYGSPDGVPAFYLHGYVGSRVDASLWHETAVAQGVRLVCIDRPGFGLSSFQPGRQLLALPMDISRLAKYLGFESYYVYGQSGGGPYAVACAYVLPREELKGVGVVSGLGPRECGTKGMRFGSRMLFWSLAYTPWLVRIVVSLLYGKKIYTYDQKRLEKWWKSGLKSYREKDRVVLEEPAVVKAMTASMREGFRQGVAAFMQDGEIFTSDWGFELGEVNARNILLFHGTEDENVPVSHARHMAEKLPHAELIEFEGDTHFTIYPKKYPEIMAQLLKEGQNRFGDPRLVESRQ